VSDRHDRCPILLALTADRQGRDLSTVNELGACEGQFAMGLGVPGVLFDV
jgi:hypothetical protein